MQNTKISLAMASILGAFVATDALAIDLYVDQKTQQIFAEPGPNRVKLGTFERVEDNAAQKAETESQKKDIANIKDDLALKNNEIKSLDEHINDPNLAKLRLDEKGVRFESADGNFEMQINGRVQIDSEVNDNQGGVQAATGSNTTNQLANGMGIRRARLSMEGSMFKDYGYKLEYDFTRGNGSTASGVTDAFMTWKGYAPATITIGQFKEPMSIEEATSDIQTSFIERNMAVNAFLDNNNIFKLGLGGVYSQPRWTAQGAIQTESIGNGAPTYDSSSTNSNFNANRNNGSGDTGWGLTARVTGLPWFQDKSHFLHLGTSGSERYLNVNPLASGSAFGANGSGARFGSNLNTNVDRTLVLDTGFISTPNGQRTTQTVDRFGGEAAFVYGPFSFQSEYLQANVSGNGMPGGSLNGYYGFMSFFLTGESRNYKNTNATFDRIKPTQNFTSRGGWGAWELLTGYDHLDLNSGIIQGGRASTGKVGLNWYPNSRFRLMANFIHVLDLETANVAAPNGNTTTGTTTFNNRSRAFNGAHPDIIEMRAQVDW